MVSPAVGNAFSHGFNSHPVSLAARGAIGSFTPASVDPRLADELTVRGMSHVGLFRFTPAGDTGRRDRSITVAVRVDGDAARALSVRNALGAMPVEAGAAPVRIAPSVYNLGLARGYDSFAISGADGKQIRNVAMPDLSDFAPGKSAAADTPSRFAPSIEMDEKQKAGRAPRAFDNQGDYQVDLGGSYRLTRNLKVTAGVRYSSERDRVLPISGNTQDGQAVYVGTQFRF
ncbi:MAG: hypothetical protein KGL48_03460 [Sphingomonadales bacterium]|nr:hypothetical protein [Sphingomonadales bacterium]MDE2567957.1 hypothetical protein [Sphingomonadales bacterium]